MKAEMMVAIFWILLPLLVFFLGVFLQGRIKGKSGLTLSELKERLKGANAREERATPVFPHLRRRGYNVSELEQTMGKMESDGRQLYREMLWWDLLFPLFYGVAFIIAFINLHKLTGSSTPRIVCWIPLVAMAADWVENSILLAQFDRFQKLLPLSQRAIKISSSATITKFYTIIIQLIVLTYFSWLLIFSPYEVIRTTHY
jgi:hypothetical protein